MIRVLHMMPDLELGGGQVLLLRNLSAMDRSEFEHIVCTVWARGGANGMHEQFRAAGIAVETLGLRSPAGIPAAAARLRRIVKRRRIDVIHTNNTGSDRLFGQAAALWCRRPLVNSLHSSLYLGRRSRGAKELVRRTRLAVDRVVARRAIKRIIAVGHGVHGQWREYLGTLGIGDDRVSVVHPGVDLSRFRAGSEEDRRRLRESLGVGDASPLLITVARLVNGKGHALLMPLMARVLAEYPRARLLLAGDGDLRRDLEAQAQREGVAGAVVFAGRRDDVPALLDAADLVVFPSLAEGFPLSIIEAMAAARPIAAFELPSFAELGEEGQRCLATAPVGDGEALTRVVLGLLGDPGRMRDMAAAGRRLVEERFRQEATSGAIAAIYRELAGAAAVRAR